MKVLIVGGTGLISSEITDQLLRRGDDVVVFNRGITPVRSPRKPRVIVGDRDDDEALASALRLEMPDAVIDMVAYEPSQADSLIAACRGRTAQIVVCSTVCVYGGPLTQLPAKENEPHRPVGDYGKNKSEIEQKILSDDVLGSHSTVIRPSFTTGEGAPMNGLLFDDTTVDRLRRGLPVIVMDDGKAAWSIAHASDVAAAFVGALGNKKAFHQAYHVSGEERTDWNGIFQAIAEAAGAKPPQLVGIPSAWLYAQAPRRSVAIEYIYRYPSIFDNSKAALDLGFRPRVTMVDTFKRQIAWNEKEGRLRNAAKETVQSELIEAWRSKRDADHSRFVDQNPWGNSPTN